MRRPAVVAVVVAVAAVLVGTSTPPASAAPHRGESITVVFVGTPGVTGTVVARGSVFDVGTPTPSDSDTDALVFPDGTLLIHQSGTTVVHPPTPPACIVWFTTTGTYHVVGGTGRFAGATGTGTTTDSGLELASRSGTGCGDTGLFVYDRIDIRGSLITR